MSKDVKWNQVSEGTPLWTCTYRIPKLVCRSFAVKLKDGRFLVGSPGTEGVESFQEELGGDVGFLLAPNSFHHMGLHTWGERYGEAQGIAAPGAHKRLAKKGHALSGLAEVQALLPDGMELVDVPNNRIGETWLTATAEDGGRIWVVCDAFFNNTRAPKAMMGRVMMSTLRSGPGLSISRLYSWGAVKGRAQFKSWLLGQIERERPTVLIPNHGKILEDPELAQKVRAVTEAHL